MPPTPVAKTHSRQHLLSCMYRHVHFRHVLKMYAACCSVPAPHSRQVSSSRALTGIHHPRLHISQVQLAIVKGAFDMVWLLRCPLWLSCVLRHCCVIGDSTCKSNPGCGAAIGRTLSCSTTCPGCLPVKRTAFHCPELHDKSAGSSEHAH